MTNNLSNENKYFKLINENGYTYRFKPSKNKSTKNILFIHGFATTSEYHDEVIDKLTDDFNYYALELPGHGFAKLKHKIHLNPLYYAQYISTWINQKGFENLYLIGHSMGGGLAILLSNLVGEKLAKLIAVTPMNSSMWTSLKSLISTNKLLPDTYEKNWKSKSILLHKPEEHYGENSTEELVEETNYFLDHLKDFKFLRKNMKSIKLYNELKKAESNNRVESMVIIGKYDGVVTYHKTLKRFSSLQNYEIKTFEESAHLPFVEENDKYIETVLNFFNSVKSTKDIEIDQNEVGYIAVENNELEQASDSQE